MWIKVNDVDKTLKKRPEKLHYEMEKPSNPCSYMN